MNRTSSNVMKVPLLGKTTPRKSHFKCTIVGDAGCGKTSLLRSYCTKLTFPYTMQEEGIRRTASQYPVKKFMKGMEYSATISDTDSMAYERRLSAYKNSDAIIICFSLVDKSTFKSVKDIWLKEVRSHCPNTPVILVGTKSDLVHSPTVSKKDIVTSKKIHEFLSENFVHEYCESSALTKDGLEIVFEQLFEAAWIGPVRYVLRMKTVKPSTRLRLIFLPCLFRRSKQAS